MAKIIGNTTATPMIPIDVSSIEKDLFNIQALLDDATSGYAGKKLSILGASYDLVNSNYDVNSEDEIWWGKVCKALDMAILKNNSVSGSTVTGSAENSACQTRCEDLHLGAESPDVIIITVGGNDFKNEIPIGSYDGNGDFPTDTSTFREAYSIMLNKITTKYPEAEILVCTRPYIYECNGNVVFPEKNDNGVLLKEWNEAIIDIANLFGVRVIDQTKCGITWQNRNLFGGDYKSDTGWVLHPNKWGHSAMANEVIRTIAPWCSVRYPIFEKLSPIAVVWEQGTIYKGEESESDSRIRTADFIADNVYKISCASGYELLLCLANSDGTGLNMYYDKNTHTTPSTAVDSWSNEFDLRDARKYLEGYKIRFICRKTNGGTMSINDAENIVAFGVNTEAQ